MSGLALVIDDNTSNQKVLLNLLKLEGMDTIGVSNPLDLEGMLDSLDNIDVVFLDLEMPNMDGFEVLEILQAQESLSNVPIVAYTVHVSEINLAREHGFHSFLGKPLDADAFPKQLARILKNERVWVTSR